MNQLLPNVEPSPPSLIQCQASDSFQQWLAQAGGSLAISTYQSGKLAMVGWDGAQVTLLLRQFQKPMGIALQGQQLAIANLTTGELAGTLEFTSGCQEISAIQFLPQIYRPTILNAEKSATRQAFTTSEFSYWLRPSAISPPN